MNSTNDKHEFQADTKASNDVAEKGKTLSSIDGLEDINTTKGFDLKAAYKVLAQFYISQIVNIGEPKDGKKTI